MPIAAFLAVHPVLGVSAVSESIRFYTERLGFILLFVDSQTNPRYAAIQRGNVQLHLQWHEAAKWENGLDRPPLRFVVENLEDLFEEYSEKGVFHSQTALRNTPWGTREFAFYDPDRNGLTFYQEL